MSLRVLTQSGPQLVHIRSGTVVPPDEHRALEDDDRLRAGRVVLRLKFAVVPEAA
jgi:hypothetical protein